MKKLLQFTPKVNLCAVLLLGLFLSACAGRPGIRVERVLPETAPPQTVIPEITPPEIPPPTPLELAVQRVQRNGRDIEKYFVLREGGIIETRAALREGTMDFEVVYDFERAEALSDSVFRVRFLIGEKELEMDIVNAFLEGEDALINTRGISAQDTLIWRPGPGTAGLLLAMDDQYFETWERHFDLFDKYGARVTFFIQGDYTPFSANALARGHDVGFHSINHPDLRRVSPEDFATETYLGAEVFRQEGVPVSSYAFPFGFSEPWMHEALREHFGVLRGYGVTFRIYTEDEIRSGFISSRAIDNTVIQGEENFERVVNLMLRTLKFLDDGRILPLTTHDISDAHWAISQHRLEFVLQTAVDLNLKFYLYSDFVE